MKQYEIKNISDGVLDVDDKSRRVKIALNKAGVKDNDSDIIERNAFDKTIRERGPKGKNLIWHLTDHHPSLKHAVGKFKELFMEGDFLVGITDIPETTWGNDVLEFYKSGAINQHSIGYATVKFEIFNDDDWQTRYRVLKELTLFEGSAVLWGANEFTPTLTVGKSLSLEETKSEFQKTMDDLGTMHKMFKTGHLSDSSYELIEMKILQLTNKLQQLFDDTTLAAAKAPEPDSKGLLDVLQTFNNKLKTANNGRQKLAGAA
jgi:uncharacterized protein